MGGDASIEPRRAQVVVACRRCVRQSACWFRWRSRSRSRADATTRGTTPTLRAARRGGLRDRRERRLHLHGRRLSRNEVPGRRALRRRRLSPGELHPEPVLLRRLVRRRLRRDRHHRDPHRLRQSGADCVVEPGHRRVRRAPLHALDDLLRARRQRGAQVRARRDELRGGAELRRFGRTRQPLRRARPASIAARSFRPRIARRSAAASPARPRPPRPRW